MRNNIQMMISHAQMPARTPDYVQWIGRDRVLRMPLKSTGSEQN